MVQVQDIVQIHNNGIPALFPERAFLAANFPAAFGRKSGHTIRWLDLGA
jgi:hypothetical protein